MKKLVSMLCGLAVFGMMFTSCEKEENSPVGENILFDGFYVVGEATAVQNLQSSDASLAMMANGINEVDKKQRPGLYEKYVALEAGKEFSLVLKEGENETVYGAELKKDSVDGSDYQVKMEVLKGVLSEGTKMKVEKSGLYHIALDLNKDNSLTDKVIVVAPVEWNVNNFAQGWTKLTPSEFNSKTMTFKADLDSVAGGNFKFAYGEGWKITLDAEGKVKVETNLGKAAKGGLASGGKDIPFLKGKNITIILTWNLNGGNVGDSFKYDLDGNFEFKNPKDIVVGFSGDAFAESGAGDWSTPSNGTLAVFDAAASKFEETSPYDGTYVYTLKGLKFNETKGFKARCNDDWIAFGDFNIEGDKLNFTGKAGDNVIVTTTKTYDCTFTLVWKDGFRESLTVDFKVVE